MNGFDNDESSWIRNSTNLTETLNKTELNYNGKYNNITYLNELDYITLFEKYQHNFMNQTNVSYTIGNFLFTFNN